MYISENQGMSDCVLVRILNGTNRICRKVCTRSCITGIGSYTSWRQSHGLLSVGWRTRKAVVLSEGWRRWISQLTQRDTCTPPLLFCSIQALDRLDDARLHWGGPPLLSVLIQMPVSSRNSLSVTPGNKV